MSYRIEYAKSARSGCSGPKPCQGAKIDRDTVRFGTLVTIVGNTTIKWRHWGCVTSKILQNIKKDFPDPSDLDGFEDLRQEDQERVLRAVEQGQVDDDDVPETAKITDEEGHVFSHKSPGGKARAIKAKKAKDEEDVDDAATGETTAEPVETQEGKKVQGKGKKTKVEQEESKLGGGPEEDSSPLKSKTKRGKSVKTPAARPEPELEPEETLAPTPASKSGARTKRKADTSAAVVQAESPAIAPDSEEQAGSRNGSKRVKAKGSKSQDASIVKPAALTSLEMEPQVTERRTKRAKDKTTK